MNAKNHDQKIYGKEKSSTGSPLAELCPSNQNNAFSYLPPEHNSGNIHKKKTDDRKTKAREKERKKDNKE